MVLFCSCVFHAQSPNHSTRMSIAQERGNRQTAFWSEERQDQESQQTNGFETLLRNLSSLPNDQIIPRRFDNFFCHGLHLVNLQNPLHLHEKPMNEPKIASGNANNCADRLLIRKILGPHLQA